jgi:uncharacterized membrane protein YgcG
MGVVIFCNFVKTLKSSNLRLNLLKAFAMKRTYTLLFAVLFISVMTSCSVSKNSTTTDDVYYSPASPANITAAETPNNSEYYSTPNENYVKMRVQNPDKWSYFDDYATDYYGGYSPYGYGSSFGLSIGFGTGFYSPYYGGFGYYSPWSYYNSYYAWNSFYNPYYGGVVIVNGKNTNSPVYTRMSTFNPASYQGNYYNTRPGIHGNSNSSRYVQPYSSTNPNNNFNRSTNTRPSYSNPSPMRSSPSNFSIGGSSGGGGGGMRGGGGSRPGR